MNIMANMKKKNQKQVAKINILKCKEAKIKITLKFNGKKKKKKL